MQTQRQSSIEIENSQNAAKKPKIADLGDDRVLKSSPNALNNSIFV